MIRRRFLLSAGAGLVVYPTLALALPDRSAGEAKEWVGEDGEPVSTWRLPSEIEIETPGVLRVGGASPSVIIAEFFDYNCPWCKKSASPIDRALERDSELRLLFVQNAILSLGSVQAAKVVLAAKKIADDRSAYLLHKSLLFSRGRVDGLRALDEASNQKLDRAELERVANSEEISAQLRTHAKIARSLGMETTPSFAAHGIGVSGWPGVAGFETMIGNLRRCDAVSC